MSTKCRICEKKATERFGNIVVCCDCYDKNIPTVHLSQLLNISPEKMYLLMQRDMLPIKPSHKLQIGKLTCRMWDKAEVKKLLKKQHLPFFEMIKKPKKIKHKVDITEEQEQLRFKNAMSLFNKNLNVALRA